VSHRVLHVGPDHREPGGMAHVIRSYLDARLDPWDVEAVASYSEGSRVRWLWRLLSSLGVVALSRRRRTAGVHVHASERFDLVRCLLLLEVARLRRLPRVLTLHGSEFMHDVHHRPRLVRAMIRRADVVTALSPETEAAARSFGGRRVLILPNPVRIERAPGELTGRTQILFAGEIGRRKGVDVLLHAWPAVRAASPAFSLLLVGPVAQPDVIAALPDGATYGGVLEREAVVAALDGACLAVLPSRAEAMPMFVLEAMAAGVPVVATPVGSVEAMVGAAGVVVPVGDADALAEAMVDALADPERLAEMGREARRRAVEQFSSEAFERRVVDLYDATFGRAV
jgi:glycosyltransferase involved in cell wall biosynthesis